jgi:uncharacterized protein YgbK (DUF1537 family)
MTKIQSATRVFEALPTENKIDLSDSIVQVFQRLDLTIVVLDDDPTGTQTVHDIKVLTSWSFDAIADEFAQGTSLFYILTNSRALSVSGANALATEIGENLIAASKQTGRKFFIVSRSDSTLRGHYPNEVDALLESIGQKDAITFLVPAFFEGGRYTIQDVHYILEKERLVPVSKTPFARDKTFGFRNANLKLYVEEKTNGKIKAADVFSISIEELRSTEAHAISEKIRALPSGAVCIVNAASYQDLNIFVLAMYNSERRLILRSAASIVPVLAGIQKKPLLQSNYFQSDSTNGLLAIVGSYVPKTSLQLDQLKTLENVQFLELNVNKILRQAATFQADVVIELDQMIGAGIDVVMYTSRKLIADQDPEKSLQIGQQVSKFISGVVSSLNEKPRAILAKGGITSSDVATKGLNVKKAVVAGQVAAGVPVWKLGSESKYPGINYIVFPGNVGTDQTLKEVFVKISQANRHH